MAVFAGLHGAIMLLMIVSSVISREFVFSFPRSKYPPPFRRYFSSRSEFQESRKRLRLFGPYGIFGIKNPHFVSIFHIMQLVQAAFRAYQAAQLSALAPQMITVWSYAALIVAHCCSFPVIRRLCKNSPGRERLCYTLCDVLLAFVTTIVVPQFLAHKYVKLYDRKTTTFPPEVLNDNVTTATLVVEMQHILVASWTDLLTRVVMCISMLMSVTDAAGLLRKTRNTRHDSVLSTAGPSTILLTRWL